MTGQTYFGISRNSLFPQSAKSTPVNPTGDALANGADTVKEITSRAENLSAPAFGFLALIGALVVIRLVWDYGIEEVLS